MPLLKAAFSAGFTLGKGTRGWGRLAAALDRATVRGPWRTRTVKSAPQGSRPPVGGFVLAALVMLALTALFTFGDLARYLPAQLLLTKTENEAAEARTKILAAAEANLGKPYIYGSTGPDGFDCSGFTIATFKNALGYSFQGYGVRTSAQMAAKSGEPVAREDLQPGDLLFFQTTPSEPGVVTHVAIYVNPDRIIHANSYTKDVSYDRFATSSYYNTNFLWARRIVKPDPAYVQPVVTPQPMQNEPFTELPPSDPTRPADGSLTLAMSGVFPDVPSNSPYAAAIALLKERNVVSGYPDGTFQPNRTVSRVELLKFAFRAFNVSPEQEDADFADVPSSHWGNPFIATAAARGWVQGPGDGKFYPDNTVTRAEAAKILFQVGGMYFQSPPVKPLYPDTPVTAWVAPYAAEVKDQNLIETAGIFEPNRGMNRELVAEFLVRVLRSQGRA